MGWGECLLLKADQSGAGLAVERPVTQRLSFLQPARMHKEDKVSSKHMFIWVGGACVLVAAMLFWRQMHSSLEIGGGMAYQAIPLDVEAGKAGIWQLEVAAWGEGPPVRQQVQSVRMDHRLVADGQWKDAELIPGSPTVVSVGSSVRLQYRFAVVAPSDSVGSLIEARFHVVMGNQSTVIDGSHAAKVVSPNR